MREEDQDAADASRVVDGDLNAFEGIVRRWQHRLVNMAWRFCRDRAMAEDMAQEVFLRTFRSLASFRKESEFSTWLISIALNTYRTRLRAEGVPLLSLDPLRVCAIERSSQHQLEDAQRDDAVRRAVLTLPEHYREAIVVYYFEEKNLAEAASVLGIAEGTLKARLHRGRGILRHRCANLGSDMTDRQMEER